MFRRKGKSKIPEPMPKRQLQKIVKGFKRQGGIIQMDDATDAYLESKMAEAITLNKIQYYYVRNLPELVFHPDRNRSCERSVTHHCVVKISSRWPPSPAKFCLALVRTRPLTTPFSVRMEH